MNTIWNKSAAILSFVIGAMAIFAGGKVLLGQDPGYYVIDWVPVYNFTVGVVSFFVTAILLWKNNRYALPAAVVTLIGHSTVMVFLQTTFREVVAAESIRAMTIRITAWSIILVLLLIQKWVVRGARKQPVKAQRAN